LNKQSDYLKTILNLSKYHREHEKYYAWEPLEKSILLQQSSAILKSLADRWKNQKISTPKQKNPYVGCEDLNETSTIQHTGVLFMEGEGEPPEISRMKRDLQTLAKDFEETGEWLSKAMESSWEAARPLLEIPNIASVLGERHRIIANDWQAAFLSIMVSNLSKRALEILDQVDFEPKSIREDLLGPRIYFEYLYSASELLDRAADVASESSVMVHDNERRWRVFRKKIVKMKEEIEDNEND
jgi:hypothetical protein